MHQWDVISLSLGARHSPKYVCCNKGKRIKHSTQEVRKRKLK